VDNETKAPAIDSPRARWDALIAEFAAVNAVKGDDTTDDIINRAGELIEEIMATPAPDAEAVRWKLDYLLDPFNQGYTGSYSAEYTAQTVDDYRRLLTPMPATSAAAWEQAKAVYMSATDAEEVALTGYRLADKQASDFYGPGPQREVHYTDPGFDNGKVLLRPHETKRTLTLRDAEDPPAGLEDHPDFIAYQQEARAWSQQRAECHSRAGLHESSEACSATFARRTEAWRAMVSYPVATLAELADKLEVAMPYADVAEDQAVLLQQVHADVRRLIGEA
jgi:hypothetical protein